MAYNILLVDDSPTVRAVLKKTLALAQVPTNEIHQAGNGKEALDILADNWIDIVFADINMPIMGGVEMVEKMGDDGMLRTIPVVVVTTEGGTTRMEQLLARGVRAYVRKPFTPEIIRNVVLDILGEAKDEQPAE
ncbi:MAG: response regulator [Propionibacteriaceae bacterium]|nr:response regulator [Propionibacteriaceae bacterium]